MSSRFPLLVLSLVVFTSLACAQQRKSPHVQTSVTVDGKTITVEYGRPYAKGREIFGGLVPHSEVWRTGADEATTLTTTADLMLGALHVPAGTYSLFTIPGEQEWTLILNKNAKQWGAFDYDASQDLGRAPMTVEALSAPVEQLTIDLADGKLSISWSKTKAAVDIVVH